MNDFQEHARMLDLLQSRQDDGSLKFSWNGSDWKILPGGAKFQRKNDFGGFALSCDLMLTCTTAQFGDTLPDSGEGMTYRGLDYTIQAVTTPPGSYQIRIEANLNVGEKK